MSCSALASAAATATACSEPGAELGKVAGKPLKLVSMGEPE